MRKWGNGAKRSRWFHCPNAPIASLLHGREGVGQLNLPGPGVEGQPRRRTLEVVRTEDQYGRAFNRDRLAILGELPLIAPSVNPFRIAGEQPYARMAGRP